MLQIKSIVFYIGIFDLMQDTLLTLDKQKTCNTFQKFIYFYTKQDITTIPKTLSIYTHLKEKKNVNQF